MQAFLGILFVIVVLALIFIVSFIADLHDRVKELQKNPDLYWLQRMRGLEDDMRTCKKLVVAMESSIQTDITNLKAAVEENKNVQENPLSKLVIDELVKQLTPPTNPTT